MEERFLSSVCTRLGKDSFFSLDQEAELGLKFAISAIQDPQLFVSRRRAFLLSGAIVNEQGEIDRLSLEKWIEILQTRGHFFSPDSKESLQAHFLKILIVLKSKEALTLLRRFSLPLCHRFAQDLIRYSLYLPRGATLTDGDVRRAVVSALLTPLRQTVGSCFATAPAIVIQQDFVIQLLQDLYNLLFSSRLKRTFGGKEYAVPMNFSTGVSALRKSVLSPFALLCPGLGPWVEEGDVEKKNLNVEQFIEAAVLERLGLSEGDLLKAQAAQKAQVQHFQRGVGSFIPLQPSLVAKWELFKEQKEEALESFKAVCDHPLLKIWEFTLASFSEVKMEFSQWNFAVSLGFSHEQEGGIGSLLFRELQSQIDTINRQIQQYQKEYELAFDQVRGVEILLRSAGSEAEGRRLKAEHQSRLYHMRSCLEVRDQTHEKGSHLAGLFSFLITEYNKLFPLYFQEVYDPNMQDVQEGFYEDSPAGFRLVYKHGRQDPHLWTLIENAQSYLESIADFFKSIEQELVARCGWEGSQDIIADLTSKILLHLQDPIFLKTALQRTVNQRPWSYTSGGTMTTLVKTYYGLEKDLEKEEKWVESPLDLLVFILDTLKSLPPGRVNPYLEKKRQGMLMSSPTHAFVLMPDWIAEGWQTNDFTYTWVRDQIFLPSLHFYEKMVLSPQEQRFLYEQLGLPCTAVLHSSGIAQVREKMAALMPKQLDLLDAFLYESVPLIPADRIESLVSSFLSQLGVSPLLSLPAITEPFITARAFHELVKGCYLLAEQRSDLSFDLHRAVAEIAKREGTAQPTSWIFADTNWPGYYFAFVVSPATLQLDLWRVSRDGLQGVPMSSWRQWLNGQDKKTWCIYQT